MNNIYKIFSVLVMAVMMLASCSPDKYELGSVDVKSEDLVEGIAFKIEHDASNPNIVYLKSLMDSKYTPLWNHPQGRSQEKVVTLKIPFEGTYNVQFGVETPGGIVYGEPVTFTINSFYADFVNDELWTNLTGGVGNSKIWIHDNGEYGLASGEVDYASPEVTQEYNNFEVNWSPGAGHTEDANIWNSTMTFSLEGGAFVQVHNASSTGDVNQSGTFMLDTDAKTLTFSDAELMHTQGWSYKTANWSRGLKILTLNENQLQVAILRDPATSGEDEWWIIWNFVSKEYADNYVPAVEPEPSLPDNWQNDISQTVTTAIKWVLSPETPFNWANLDGSLMNNWATLADYPDWTGFDANVPATYAKFSLTLDSDDNSVVYVDKDGNEQSGTYTLDEKGFYTFNGLSPNFNICSGINLNTSADNQWRITAIEKDAAGKVTGMWVGVRDVVKAEYIVYHLIPQAGTSGTDDPDTAVKKMLCAHTWKIDIGGTKFGGPLTYASPATFPTLTDEWTPVLADNSWVMIDGDHGSMKFNIDGTVNISQKSVVDGAFGETANLSGNWSLDGETLKLTLDIPILHADNFTFAVRDWGDSRMQSIGSDFLRLCVVRDAELSGEGEWLFIYNYIPSE